MLKIAVPVLALALVAPVRAAQAPEGDPPSYHLVIEAMDSDGSNIIGTFPAPFFTMADAFAQAEKIGRNGYCFVLRDPPIPDPTLVALCYPPARILRTEVKLY